MFKCESSDNTCRTIEDLKVVVKLAIENWNIIFLYIIIGTTTKNLDLIPRNVKIRFTYENLVVTTFYFTTMKNLAALETSI